MAALLRAAAAFALALSAIFISYAAQPYGNLRDASVTTTDLSGVRWSVDYALDEDSKTAYVYQAQALDNAGADRFAAGIRRRARRRISGCVLLR